MALFAFVGYLALRSNRHFAFDRCSTHDTPMPRYLAKVVGNGVRTSRGCPTAQAIVVPSAAGIRTVIACSGRIKNLMSGSLSRIDIPSNRVVKAGLK